MRECAWFSLTPREQMILQNALLAYAGAEPTEASEIGLLAAKLRRSEPYPAITIGVHGGQVQWSLGNPFPIRVYDYDSEMQELPDVDERGQRCRIWFEPPDTDNVAA
jgi:hypothetical protein